MWHVNIVFDFNNDGEIDANELQQALGDDYDIDTIKDIIDEVDTDGNQKLSLQEFTDAMKETIRTDINQVRPLGPMNVGLSVVNDDVEKK